VTGKDARVLGELSCCRWWSWSWTTAL